MEDNVVVVSPASSMMPEGEVGYQIIEEGPRICPLCSSVIELLYINYHEKLLMCENPECIFPFGCEELYFEKLTGNDEDDMSDIVSSRSQSPRSLGSTTDSDISISEIEILNKLCKSLSEPTTSSKFPNKVNKKMENGSGITKSQKKIKNKKWNKNLMHFQHQSGRKLVQPQEIEKLTKREEVVTELNIDIEPGTSGCM